MDASRQTWWAARHSQSQWPHSQLHGIQTHGTPAWWRLHCSIWQHHSQRLCITCESVSSISQPTPSCVADPYMPVKLRHRWHTLCPAGVTPGSGVERQQSYSTLMYRLLQDKEQLATFCLGSLGQDLVTQELAVSGRNWGSIALIGSSLMYKVDDKVMLEVPLPDVSQAQQTKVGSLPELTASNLPAGRYTLLTNSEICSVCCVRVTRCCSCKFGAIDNEVALLGACWESVFVSQPSKQACSWRRFCRRNRNINVSSEKE